MTDIVITLERADPITLTLDQSGQSLTLESGADQIELVMGSGWRGLSAYAVALANGFEGTEEEWLASLAARAAANLQSTGTAATALGGHRAVRLAADGVRYADKDSSAAACVGITTGAVSLGAEVTFVTAGNMEEGSWTWSLGPVYLGADGLLTQTPPSSGVVLQVAYALSATVLNVAIRQPIQLI
jgi:hypothetical protein